MSNQGPLRPEEYLEPDCPLCGNPYESLHPVRPVPQQRILNKLDDYMSRRDYDGAERHLLYWLKEAEQGRDLRGQLLVCNELIGHYRKTGSRENSFRYAELALSLLEDMDFESSISAGTTYVNAATAYSAFGDNQRALELFERAKTLYESTAHTQAHLLGGLYNNMALVLQTLGRFPEAFELYNKAMKTMETVPGGVLEQAITCLNMADAVAAQFGQEEGEARIFELLDRADELLHDKSAPHNGYYAFVCEKCSPTFSYYGYFAVAEELQREAKEIYERA
jgi:tetratricopeptide (TPR) repeat protein